MAKSYGKEPFYTWMILDSIDISEFELLKKNEQEYVKIIISAGIINFREGSPMWNALMIDIFPEGTITHANIKRITEHTYDETETP